MNRWQAIPRHAVSTDDWEALVDASSEGWLWHRAAFQEVLTTWPTRNDSSFGLVGPEGRLAAVVPVHVITRGIGPLRLRRLDSFGGPCRRDDLGRRVNRSVGAAVVHELRVLADRHQALRVDVTLPPLAPAWRRERGVRVNPMVELGLDDRSGYTWVADLSGDDGWGAIQDGTRSHIRSAEAAGVRVETAGETSGLLAYLDLHQQTYRRTGATPHPPSYFEGIWRELIPQGRAHALIAHADGEPVAGITVWIDKAAAGYWTGASTERGRELHATDLLQWRAMTWAAQAGCTLFDSGEATFVGRPKDRAISDFKRKFGGRLEPVFRSRIESSSAAMRFAWRAVDAATRSGR